METKQITMMTAEGKKIITLSRLIKNRTGESNGGNEISTIGGTEFVWTPRHQDGWVCSVEDADKATIDAYFKTGSTGAPIFPDKNITLVRAYSPKTVVPMSY